MASITKKILIQKIHSLYFVLTIRELKKYFEIIAVFDDQMGEALLENGKDITAIVIFRLTEDTQRVAKLARNERFCDPTIPIAYVGNDSAFEPLPFGCVRYGEKDIPFLSNYISTKVNISALVVEDDDALRDITAMTLSRLMKVETASTGDEAFRLVQAKTYDVIILDVMLPGMSGEEIFSYVNDYHKDTAVVIITAYDSNEREFHFSFEQVAGYIKKPFESNKVFRNQVMESIIKQHFKSESRRLVVLRSQREIALTSHRLTMSRYI